VDKAIGDHMTKIQPLPIKRKDALNKARDEIMAVANALADISLDTMSSEFRACGEHWIVWCDGIQHVYRGSIGQFVLDWNAGQSKFQEQYPDATLAHCNITFACAISADEYAKLK